MRTFEETLELEVAKRQELVEKVRTEYKKVDSIEAVKMLLDGKTMSYLGKLEGSSEIQLLHVMIEQMHVDFNAYRFVVLNENLRCVEEINHLPRLLAQEWYERVLTDRETLLSLGYDQVQVAKMSDEDVEAEMEQLAAGGME